MGATPTHFGHCGVCSSLENLAVCMKENDLTAPVRACGLSSVGFQMNVACLLCGETQSGPVFKAVAGRTRRNSGLPKALCRPCSEVRPLVRAY